MFNLAQAATQWFIAVVTTNAKGALNNNLLFIDTSRMLHCYFKLAKNWTAFAFWNANLVFARSVLWRMLIAESHSGGTEPKSLCFQHTNKDHGIRELFWLEFLVEDVPAQVPSN